MNFVSVKHKIFHGCAVSLMAIALGACNSTNTSKDDSAINNVFSQVDDTVPSPTDHSKNLRAYCPAAQIRPGTEVYRSYNNGVKKEDPNSAKSLKIQSTIARVVRECNYSQVSLHMKVGIEGRVINGPSAASGTFNVPVRIAMIKPATKDVVFTKLYQVPVIMPPGQTFAPFSFVESDINIPIPERNSLLIYVGFDEGPIEPVTTN